MQYNSGLPPSRYTFPGDHDKQLEIPFSLAELKSMQGIILDKIKWESVHNNTEYLPHRALAEKIEYYITELERP